MKKEYKTSEARRKANKKYDESIDRVLLRMPSGKKAIINNHIQKQNKNETLNSFINRAIDETIKRDNK